MTAAFASRLPNGNTLITDAGNNRIIEVTPSKQIVFQYFTNTSANSNASPNPTNAVRLSDGDTMIADQFNSRVILINPQKQIMFQYGMTNVTGNGFDQLFDPLHRICCRRLYRTDRSSDQLLPLDSNRGAASSFSTPRSSFFS